MKNILYLISKQPDNDLDQLLSFPVSPETTVSAILIQQGMRPHPSKAFWLFQVESIIPNPKPWIFVAGFGQLGSQAGFALLDSLRSHGMIADTDHNASSLKAHLRSADRLSAPYVLILGDDEVSQDQVILRNMLTKQQETIPLSQASSSLKERFLNPSIP